MKILATKLENLRGKSNEIVEERSNIEKRKSANDIDRALIKEILSRELRDDTDLGYVSQVDNVLGTEKTSIDSDVISNNKEIQSTVEETDAYIRSLESNLLKLSEMDRVTDLKIGDKSGVSNTERRIDELWVIREMLTNEGDREGKSDISAGDFHAEYSDRGGFYESLCVNVEQAKYQYCLGVLTKGDLPNGYENIISERHQNAEPNVRKIFDYYASQLNIKDANYPPDKVQHYSPNGSIGHPRGVYYNASEDANNPRGNGSTYYHELAHMIDHASTGFKRNLSNTAEFEEALMSDSKRILDAYNNCTPEQQRRFINSLRGNNRTHSFQDILDATTGGVISAGWGHTRDYWSCPGNLQAEAFAHFFEASMGANDKVELFKRYFPTAFAVFLDMINNIQPMGDEKVLERNR